jgi:hypothetical protein
LHYARKKLDSHLALPIFHAIRSGGRNREVNQESTHAGNVGRRKTLQHALVISVGVV